MSKHVRAGGKGEACSLTSMVLLLYSTVTSLFRIRGGGGGGPCTVISGLRWCKFDLGDKSLTGYKITVL